MHRKRLCYLFLFAAITSLSLSTLTFGAPGDDDDDGPSRNVIVDNWQTFRPRVTALRSLNAYLATDLGQQVYYVPTLEELPNLKDTVSDCIDYAGKNQRFAAVYTGYFNPMCYSALVRKSDGNYSNVPAIVQQEGANSVRELTTLGYDFLLTREGLSDIQLNGENARATYTVSKIDATNGYVDLSTALMDIYKAVGQEKFDMQYIFTPDSTMTVENSPIQSEINVTLSQSNTLDTSAGKAWIFATRTNPDLYWKQAAYDGIVWDNEAIHGGNASNTSGNKTQEVTLAEFCAYAYNIMNIYGEPVMTQSEKNILLQLYGPFVPYQACTSAEVTAIENMIAKGIISPDDDQSKLNWNSRIDYEYMLTMLMRIKDVNARKTYKDVQITMDASLLGNNYYAANLSVETSDIVSFDVSKSAARVTNYYDFKLSMSRFSSMVGSLNTAGVDLDLFVPSHIVFKGKDGTYFPLSTQVTTQSRKVYSKDYPRVSYVQSTVDAGVDGQLLPFCISKGVETDTKTGEKYLHLRVVAFDIPDLLVNGRYNFAVMNDKGDVSPTVSVAPGGGVYTQEGTRTDDTDDMLTDETEDEIPNNEAEVNEVANLYDNGEYDKAESLAQSYINNHPNWTDAEIDAILNAAFDGERLAAEESYTYYMRIKSGKEGSITVTTKAGRQVTLADIMRNTGKGDLHYADPDDETDLGFIKINNTTYQVENCSNKNTLTERITGSAVTSTEAAFCKQNTDLLVSTKWMKESGFLSTTPIENGDVLVLATDYSNIFLDRAQKQIVVGACVYDVRQRDASEIWTKVGSDTYVNFRALLGWTGDFLIFKNSDGSIAVSIKEANKVNGSGNTITGTGSGKYSIPIKFMDIQNQFSGWGLNPAQGGTVAIQGFRSALQDKTAIPMSSMYPLANYFIYMNENVIEKDEEYHDWLFVFKPKEVKVNGQGVTYDDSESRKVLTDLLGSKLEGWGSEITVWAYPLYRDGQAHAGMPKGMRYEDEYGYIYQVPTASNNKDAMVNYFNTQNTMSHSDEPEFVLPFYIDKNQDIRCFNFNTFTDKNGVMLEYGDVPCSVMLDIDRVDETLRSRIHKGRTLLETMKNCVFGGVESIPVIIDDATNGADNYSNCTTFPAVTSPALLFLGLQEYDFETVKAQNEKGSYLFFGTTRVTFTPEGELHIGSKDFTDEIKNQKFLLMRETGGSQNASGKWFSVSALTSFSLGPGTTSSESTAEKFAEPVIGYLNDAVDVIDWEEWTTQRLLEDFEFGIAIAMILVLNILPRLALAILLLLVALGCIQNVKWWQIVCDRIWDPYKFLTFGRRDVHTFKSMTTFRNSIIAMAVFALFVDGTIIHIYEWIVQFFATIVNLR